MKIQVFGLIFFSALGLAHGLAIDSNNRQEGVQLAKRNNWDKPSSSVDHPKPHPTPVHDKSKDGHGDTKGKDCDDDKKKHGDNDKNKDGHGKDKGKDRDKNLCKDPSKCATTVDPPIDLPPPGVAIDKPYPQFDSTPGVPPTKDGDIDGTSMDENDPRVILVGTYIERLARQTAPITIPFQGDTGRIYNEQVSATSFFLQQDAVDWTEILFLTLDVIPFRTQSPF